MPNRSILVTGPGGETATSAMPAIPPGSVRKVPIRLVSAAAEVPGTETFRVEIVDPGSIEPVDVRTLEVKVVEPTAARRVTFRSEIDDSVQFYGLVPSSAAPREGDPSGAVGLILTLHGAGVDARRQAAAYSAKDFAHVVAPTNRRKFGFDWEDWGRLDAMEVLDHARRTLGTDPDRQWVTGHSMGGHGTWQAAAHFPDRFAAAAPSAGWIAFHTYGADRIEGNDDPHSIESIMARAANPSDTLLLRDNLDELGIYVLHGDADDNVPVDQARTMRRSLAESHPDFAYHEEPGVGHWWGNRCVDWPPLIRFLEERSLDPNPAQVRFTTVSPGINAGGDWFRIAQQQLANAPSRVEGTWNDAEDRIDLITENVARLEIDLDDRMPAWTVVIDGDEVGPDAKLDLLNGRGAPAFYDRTPDGWRRRAIINPRAKRPERNGSFKDVFRHQPILVVGTMGDEAENRITLAKAIHDAETFLYRGNGVLDVILDVDFDREQHPRRNVILYGNQETNAAWPQLLAKDPLGPVAGRSDRNPLRGARSGRRRSRGARDPTPTRLDDRLGRHRRGNGTRRHATDRTHPALSERRALSRPGGVRSRVDRPRHRRTRGDPSRCVLRQRLVARRRPRRPRVAEGQVSPSRRSSSAISAFSADASSRRSAIDSSTCLTASLVIPTFSDSSAMASLI
jgi:dienelactone hydrolase